MPLPRGTELFHEGDPGDAFYLVAKGKMGIYASPGADGTETRVAVLGPGDPVGEMALLTNSPRSATVRAEMDGELLRLDRARFLNLVREQPEVAVAMAATLSRRLRAALYSADKATTPAERQTTSSAAAAPETPPQPAESSSQRRRLPSPSAISGLLAGVILFFGWVATPPGGLSVEGWHALALLAAMVPLLAVEALPEGVLALALAGTLILSGVARTEMALTGFSSANWVLVVSVLAVGSAIASSGVLYRLALWTVAHIRGGFPGQILALSLAGVLMGPAVPNATGRITMIAPAVRELVEALGYAPRSRAAAGISMAALIGFGQMAAAFLTSSTTAVLVFAVLPLQTRRGLNWISWAYYAAPPNVLLLTGLIGAIMWLYWPRAEEESRTAQVRSSLELQRVLLGTPSRREHISLVAGAGLLVGFVTQPLHGAHPAWVAVLALTFLAATGVVTAGTLREVNWSFVLLFGILASISDVFTATRVDEWLAHAMVGVVDNLTANPVLFVVVLTLLCFAISLVLRWQAAAPLITIALGPVAEQAGISSLVVGLVALIACNGFFVPYQSTTYLALYHGTGGELFSHAQARRASLAYGLITLVALATSVVFWRAMGLI
ncbi:MAG: anion permease [Deltaproteobacteria bacterium]|nr:anion permease [Deltaproteobacteria bacterium]